MSTDQKQQDEAVNTGIGGTPGSNGMDSPYMPERKVLGPGKSPYKFDPLSPYTGLLRRFFQIHRNVSAIFGGGIIAFVRALPPERKKGLRSPGIRLLALLSTPLVKKDIRRLPFPQQLRKRLEMLGPTYVKLGQILALRTDILPAIITDELKNLLDRLPVVPYDVIRDILEFNYKKPPEEYFKYIDPEPLGSASIAQTHYAETHDGKRVVLKVVKPGIKSLILTDINLLKMLGVFLSWLIPQYQPKRLIDEFCNYTAKEIDLNNEADNAETFAANFSDHPSIVFPKIYREYSTENILCMELIEGRKPSNDVGDYLSDEEKQLVIDNGSAAIIRMLYKDGFFHADLHPGNLMIMKGGKVGFIDLGMVGRFEEKTRRQMLYYFHALVTGDIEGAARYLTAMARVSKGGNLNDFRRSVSDLQRRYYLHAASGDFSLAKMIVQSLGIGARHKVFFPVEMTLMVKALVTYEGVGLSLNPKLDVPALSQRHINDIFREQFSPASLSRELIRGTPELIDMAVRLPKLMADGLRTFEDSINNRSADSPLDGLRSSVLAGSCIVAGVIAIVQGGAWFIWLPLFIIAALFAFFGK
jgi:ubiquinone biosynthesis protein